MQQLRPIIPSSTNSPTGSYHWFMTLMSFHKHAGEYMATYGELSPELISAWGKHLFETSDELITWFHNEYQKQYTIPELENPKLLQI